MKPLGARGDEALMTLFQKIAARDEATVIRALTAAPALATATLQEGASRAQAQAFFLDDIKRHVYAGDTALHLAAAVYLNQLARALLARGAQARAKNRRGAEPLHYAADGIPGSPWWGPEAQAATVATLLRAGADPNAADESGVTPLHRAVRTRCGPAVAALLAHGADAHRRNRGGSTPLHLAVLDTGRSGAGAAEAREQQAGIIRALLAHGARASDRDTQGKSVREAANADWIRALLR